MNNRSAKYLDFSTNDVVLIITGCVRPNIRQRFLVLKDEEERLRQYIASVRFYISESPFTKIVFCDNSNYQYAEIDTLVKLAQSYGKEFEWLAFQGDSSKILVHGKGYGEGEIIRYALDNSKLTAIAHSFAKVTGRLTIGNIDQVIHNAKPNTNYFNRDIYRGHGTDTRFYLCDIDFYKRNLLDAYIETCELPGKECAIEDVFFMRLRGKQHCRNLMAFPLFYGCSGGNGRDYSKIPQATILLYSALCRINLFNVFYISILGIKKLRIILTKQK